MTHLIANISNLTKTYPQASTPILNFINLEIYSGQFVLIEGRSGSGKSTLIHCLAGLENFDSGEITVQGTEFSKMSIDQLSNFRLHNIGLIFQFFNLIPSMTIMQNIMLPGRLAGKANSETSSRASYLLDKLGIVRVANQTPDTVSGGEAQRAAIARALLLQPKLILADEPTGNLDEENSENVVQLFKSLTKDFNVAVCMVSHDPTLRPLADSVYKITSGQFQQILN